MGGHGHGCGKGQFQRRYPVYAAGGTGAHRERHPLAPGADRRELWEETGLRLVRIDDVLDGSYSAVGFANERNACVFGVAAGTFQKSTSDAEEIVPGWYTRSELKALLRTELFAARTQAYCYAWANGAPV